jgi:hypothetical protein
LLLWKRIVSSVVSIPAAWLAAQLKIGSPVLNSPNLSRSLLDTDCETHLALLNQLDAETFCGMRQLMDLNMVNVAVTPEQVKAAMQQLMGLRNLPAGPVLPLTDDTSAELQRQRKLIDCAHAQFVRCVEQRMAAMHQTLTDLLDHAIRSTPVRSEQEIALLQQALQGINSSYAQSRKTVEACAERLHAEGWNTSI